jgi:hypothetical protein
MMNIVERATKLLPPDNRRRSEALCAAANAAISKGDLELGQRLLIQADIDDPRNSYPEGRLQQVESEIRRLQAQTHRPRIFGRRFDFLYAPTLRGLSTELSSLLPLHPDAFCVSKTELDGAIEQAAEPALLGKYQRQVLKHRNPVKAGLVQHAYIAGQRAGPEIAERLARVTTRKLFIHGVRDPLSLVISEFNHELIARHCGAYRFWPIDPDSPFCRAEYILGASPKYNGVINHLPSGWLDSQPAASDRITALLDESLPRARHFAVGKTYAQHFKNWVPVNLERPLSGQPGVLNRVFDAIGVDSRFEHLAFGVSEGNLIHRLMVQNWIAVNAFGHTLLVGLGFADRMMFSNTFLMSEILTFDPDDRFAAALGADMKGRPLCLTVQRAHWQLLPRDVRIRLVETGDLHTFMTSILVPKWLESYARWKSAVDKYLIRNLEPAALELFRSKVGADLEQFLRRHPQFEDLWPSARKLFPA